jgi:hypothetical protein
MSRLAAPRANVKRLATLTDPVAFLRAIQDEGYFERGSPQAMAFVKRYVPLPKSLAGTWEPGFYSNPEQYRTQLRREGVHVDAAKAAHELEETVLKPNRVILEQLGRHHYLTRLYTTMSPEEMNQDPTFRFNAYLPRVDSLHQASGIRDCRKHRDGATAPIRVTLQNGTRYTIYPGEGTNGFEAGALPAAERIEQLEPMGPARVIQDNRAAIAASLSRVFPERLPQQHGQVRGFSCSQNSLPGSLGNNDPGAGEAAAYALVVLGAWGFLRRRPRR